MADLHVFYLNLWYVKTGQNNIWGGLKQYCASQKLFVADYKEVVIMTTGLKKQNPFFFFLE